MMQQTFSHPQVIGLILDIIGAFFLAKSFVFKTPKDLAAESYGTDYPSKGLTAGMSGNIFRSFYRQAVEAKIGFVILALGFLSQISGLLFPNLTINWYLGIIIVLSAISVPYTLFKFLFKSSRLDKVENEAEAELSKHEKYLANKPQ